MGMKKWGGGGGGKVSASQGDFWRKVAQGVLCGQKWQSHCTQLLAGPCRKSVASAQRLRKSLKEQIAGPVS